MGRPHVRSRRETTCSYGESKPDRLLAQLSRIIKGSVKKIYKEYLSGAPSLNTVYHIDFWGHHAPTCVYLLSELSFVSFVLRVFIREPTFIRSLLAYM
jgi:hypothetical protein